RVRCLANPSRPATNRPLRSQPIPCANENPCPFNVLERRRAVTARAPHGIGRMSAAKLAAEWNAFAQRKRAASAARLQPGGRHAASAPSILGARTSHRLRRLSSMDGTLKIPSVTGIDVELRIA